MIPSRNPIPHYYKNGKKKEGCLPATLPLVRGMQLCM